MQQKIELLYNGGIFPCEDIKSEVDGYTDDLSEVRVLENAFREDLSEEMKSKFDELKDRQTTVDSKELTQTFVEGYKLGMRMIIEALT